MNKNKALEILNILDEIYNKPECFLKHSNNYELLVAVMLSAQTTDERVNMVTPNLFNEYKDPYTLMNANVKDVENIIKSVGLYKTKAKNLILMAKSLVLNYNGQVPNDFNELVKLPGVGRKTANVVLAVGFKIPSIPVDTHVYRTSYRLGFRKSKDDLITCEEKLKRYLPQSKWIDAHHQLILFGREYCKSQNPQCENCPLKNYCVVNKNDRRKISRVIEK